MQLKVSDIINQIELFKKQYPKDDIDSLPIYIGDDDELNGVHSCSYINIISREEDANICNMIDEHATNPRVKNKAILIS